MIYILKEICLIAIMALCSYIGFSIGNSYKRRSINLIEFNNALIFLQNEILYCYTPLPEAFNKCSNKCKGTMSKMFKLISKKLKYNNVENVYIAFNDSINDYKEELYFKDEDKDVILDFARSLGECGIYGQDKIFNFTLDRLKERLKIADEECKKNQKMYRYLGVSLGAMITIFLI